MKIFKPWYISTQVRDTRQPIPRKHTVDKHGLNLSRIYGRHPLEVPSLNSLLSSGGQMDSARSFWRDVTIRIRKLRGAPSQFQLLRVTGFGGMHTHSVVTGFAVEREPHTSCTACCHLFLWLRFLMWESPFCNPKGLLGGIIFSRICTEKSWPGKPCYWQRRAKPFWKCLGDELTCLPATWTSLELDLVNGLLITQLGQEGVQS